MREPGPDHPITVEPYAGTVRVLVGDTVIARTTRALSLREANYARVLYIPREDARLDLLTKSARTTHCPYKGDARYYDIAVDGDVRRSAVWSYEDPFPAVAGIAGHLAFYEDRVDAIEVASEEAPA